MKYTVYVNSANCVSTEAQYLERNRNYFKTRAHSSVDKGFRICEDLGERYRIPYITSRLGKPTEQSRAADGHSVYGKVLKCRQL